MAIITSTAGAAATAVMAVVVALIVVQQQEAAVVSEPPAPCETGELQPQWVSDDDSGRRWAARGRSCITLPTGWRGWESGGFVLDEPGLGHKVTPLAANNLNPQEQGERREAKGGDDDNNEVNFSILWSALPPSAVQQLLQMARAARYETKQADTIDRAPTFERYVYRKGQEVDSAIYAAVYPYVERVVLPYVRQRFGPDSELCDVLLRRYLPGERRGVRTHRDIAAFVTAIITLNAADFGGGYFLTNFTSSNRDLLSASQAGSEHPNGPCAKRGRAGDACTQEQLPLGDGDVVLHQHDALHGVDITHGERYSLIMWYKDRAGVCAEDSEPWYADLAAAGDADAALREAQLNLQGTGRRGDPGAGSAFDSERSGGVAAATIWLKKAAEGGSAEAMLLYSEYHRIRSGPAACTVLQLNCATLGSCQYLFYLTGLQGRHHTWPMYCGAVFGFGGLRSSLSETARDGAHRYRMHIGMSARVVMPRRQPSGSVCLPR